MIKLEQKIKQIFRHLKIIRIFQREIRINKRCLEINLIR